MVFRGRLKFYWRVANLVGIPSNDGEVLKMVPRGRSTVELLGYRQWIFLEFLLLFRMFYEFCHRKFFEVVGTFGTVILKIFMYFPFNGMRQGMPPVSVQVPNV